MYKYLSKVHQTPLHTAGRERRNSCMIGKSKGARKKSMHARTAGCRTAQHSTAKHNISSAHEVDMVVE